MNTEYICAETLSKFDDINYQYWAILTEYLLRSKVLWEYIDESCSKSDAENKDKIKKWEKKKYKIWMIIMTNCSLTQQQFIIEKRELSHLWEKLKKINMSKSKHYLSVLSRNFFTYKQSSDEFRVAAVSDYMFFFSIWSDLIITWHYRADVSDSVSFTWHNTAGTHKHNTIYKKS